MTAAPLSDRLARAAAELRGTGPAGPCSTPQDVADRERLKAAFIAAVVLTVMSALVFIAARQIAMRRAADTEEGTGEPVATVP